MPRMTHVQYPHSYGGDGWAYDCEPCELRMLRDTLGEPTQDGVAILRGMLRMSFGDGDPWGTAVQPVFATGEILAVARNDDAAGIGDAEPAWLLDREQFHCSPALREWSDLQSDGDWPRVEIVEHIDAGRVRLADVAYWFRVTTRYADLLKAAGYAY